MALGKPRFCAIVTQNNMKGRKDKHDRYADIVLRSEPSNMGFVSDESLYSGQYLRVSMTLSFSQFQNSQLADVA
jgi:hypothetical protein